MIVKQTGISLYFEIPGDVAKPVESVGMAILITYMNLDHYDINSNLNLLDFEFDSEGPNGTIRKVVRFSPKNSNGVTYFNLGFGDLDFKTGTINDQTISNNKDRAKILATVALAVLVFTAHYPDVIVFAKGNTSARTRLYQMGICSNWKEINDVLHVYGFCKGKWQSFQKGMDCEAFLVLRK